MEWSDLGQVVIFSFCSLLVLFVLTKLMGNRQMSQLTMFDYIAGISIGSLAAEMASHPDPESWLGLVSMVIYGLVTLSINILNTRSLKARDIFLGSPLVLYDHGKLYFHNLKKAKMDLNEVMAECRGAGYFDLSLLQMILLEVNGKLSFLPNENNRPLTPEDMQIEPKQERPVVAVIMDGVLFPKRLHAVGLNEAWLLKQLSVQGYNGCGDILLATVDCDNALAVYQRNREERTKDYYS